MRQLLPHRPKPQDSKLLTESSAVYSHDRFIEFAKRSTIRSGTRYIDFWPLFAYQEAIAKLAAHYPGLVIVKDRQLGITELLTCWMLYRATENPAYAAAVFSITERDAHKISQRVKRMPSKIADFKWEIDALGVRRPENGGEINFRPSTENATRGLESIWDLFFDEAGFIPIVDEMYAASAPSQEMVGADSRTFIVSTIPPTGEDCWFWSRMDEDNGPIVAKDMLTIAKSAEHYNGTAIALPDIPGLVCWEDAGGWCKIVVSHKAHPIYGANPNYVEDQRLKKKISRSQAEREHNLGLEELETGMIDLAWFEQRRYRTPPIAGPGDKIIISLDTASKEKEMNDPSVATVWLCRSGAYYLMDVWRDRVEYPGLRRAYESIVLKWQPHECLIEDKSSGTQLIQEYRNTPIGGKIYPIIPINPQSDKVMRMSLELGAIEAGQVWLPHSAPWLAVYERELKLFPASTKDQVDSTSQFLMRMRSRPVVTAAKIDRAPVSAASIKKLF
jgi:predicted phage terminase large subunit-like protein